MPGQEREITRRKSLEWITTGLASAGISIPLINKFFKDAQVLNAIIQSSPAPQSAEAKIIPPLSQAASQPTEPQSTRLVQTVPQETNVQISQLVNLESKDAQNGLELLAFLGLKNKVVYIVYGRPKKAGEQTWGSLGASQTAEQSWQVYQERRKQVRQALGKKDQDFGLNVINPVYQAPNGEIKPIYVQKSLELAAQQNGLTALNFNSFTQAEKAIQKLEADPQFSPQLLQRLAVGLDIEHFPGNLAKAEDINRFAAWFAQKHQAWVGELPIPGLVIVYTFSGGRVLNINQLKQYYLSEKTLVVPIFDGYGSKEAKLARMASLVNTLPNTQEYPALVGVMEFYLRWGFTYDKSRERETFATLDGAPTFFFASQ